MKQYLRDHINTIYILKKRYHINGKEKMNIMFLKTEFKHAISKDRKCYLLKFRSREGSIEEYKEEKEKEGTNESFQKERSPNFPHKNQE
jgi:hypothetical protein